VAEVSPQLEHEQDRSVGKRTLGVALMVEGLGFGLYVFWQILGASTDWDKMVQSYPNLGEFEALHTTELIEQAVVITALVAVMISAGALLLRAGMSWRILPLPGRLVLIAAAMLNVILVVVCLFGLMFGSGGGARIGEAALVSLGLLVLAELFHYSRGAPEERAEHSIAP
jgi:hypothetical protein